MRSVAELRRSLRVWANVSEVSFQVSVAGVEIGWVLVKFTDADL
jgi:hypothetical protein